MLRGVLACRLVLRPNPTLPYRTLPCLPYPALTLTLPNPTHLTLALALTLSLTVTRLVLCAALAARCAEAVGSRLWHAYSQHGVRPRPMDLIPTPAPTLTPTLTLTHYLCQLRPRPMDLRRLGLHLSGAVLLLGGAMAPTLGPASPASPIGAAACL